MAHEVNEENTVENIRDDLDNYGGRLPVVIASLNERLFNVGSISLDTHQGQSVVVINVGDRID